MSENENLTLCTKLIRSVIHIGLTLNCDLKYFKYWAFRFFDSLLFLVSRVVSDYWASLLNLKLHMFLHKFYQRIYTHSF